MPVLATFFTVRRGRDPFFKFFMQKLFPKQVDRYEKEFGMRFLGWYNVAYGWDFDNVILLELPDYETIDKLEGDPRSRAIGHRAGEWMFERHHAMFLRERMGPDLEFHPVTRMPMPTISRTADPGTGRPTHDRATTRHPRRDRHGGGHRARLVPQRRRETSCTRFLEANRDRIASSAAWCCSTRTPTTCPSRPTCTFRSRSRVQDAATGEWRSETEVIESPSEIWSSCTTRPSCTPGSRRPRASRRGLPDEPTGAQDLLDVAGISPRRASAWASAARTRTSARPMTGPPARTSSRPRMPTEAARRLYDLALTFQERSQLSEARLIEQFEIAAAAARRHAWATSSSSTTRTSVCGSRRSGAFEAEVIPERDEDEEADGTVGAARSPRGAWSSSTTRPTCSATSPRRSPSSSRTRRIPSSTGLDEDDEA